MMKKVRTFVALVSSLVLGLSSNVGTVTSASMLQPDVKAHNVTDTNTKQESNVWGDADCDGSVTISDAVLIMQYLANPDKYGIGKEEGITKQGVINADVCLNGNDITAADALSIQKYLLGTITVLPESYYNGEQQGGSTTTTSTTASKLTTTTTTSTTASKSTTTTTTSTTTSKPTTTTTTSKTTSKPTTTTTTSKTTSKPTTTTTTSTTTSKPTTTTTTSKTTSKPTTTTTTTSTTTSKPTTTTTTSTTTSKPTTTTTTSTTTSKPTTTTTTSTTTSKLMTTTTTSTTTSKPTTTTTTSTTTSKPTTTTTTSTTTITQTTTTLYFYKYEDGYYYNPYDVVLGPDSCAEIYEDFLKTAETYGFEHYKIVYCKEIIPYAYISVGVEVDNIQGEWFGFQAVPLDDLQYICYDTYKYIESTGSLHSYKYVFWRPEKVGCGEEYQECIFNCNSEHHEIFGSSSIEFVLYDYWQLIPTDENGNDILKLASDSDFMIKALEKNKE